MSAQSAKECSRQSCRKRAWVRVTRFSSESNATVCSHSFQPLNHPATIPTWSRNIMASRGGNGGGGGRGGKTRARPCPPPHMAAARGPRRGLKSLSVAPGAGVGMGWAGGPEGCGRASSVRRENLGDP